MNIVQNNEDISDLNNCVTINSSNNKHVYNETIDEISNSANKFSNNYEINDDYYLTIEKEDDYDTDIEMKEEHISYDHSGRTTYIKNCYKEGVIPAGYFLRHINDKKLEMRHHGLGINGIKPICSSLMTNGRITSLDLTDNWLGDESVPYLMTMMKENCFIAELVLSNNNLTSNCAEVLLSSLSENIQITRLDLSQNHFDDQSSIYVADMLIQSPKLEYLNLSRNNFGPRCLSAFGRGISQTTTLTEFDISWNHINGKDSKPFFSGLSENQSVKVLNLGWNGFGPCAAMQDVGKMLKVNITLEELELSNNRITPEGCVLLGRGLMTNHSLKVLRIGQNPMQTAGCYAILNSVIKNPNSAINLLDFENIRVNQDFVDLQSTMQRDLIILTGSKRPLRPSSSIHPMIRLKNFVKKHKLSLLKYFNHFDDAEDMHLTINDFRLSIQYFCKDEHFEMTESEIELLIAYLDKKQNGFVYYKDFIDLRYPENGEITMDLSDHLIG